MRIRILPAAVAMIVACLPTGPLLAQNTPGSDAAATPAPAASPAQEAAPAPAASPTATAPTAIPSAAPAAASTDTPVASESKTARTEPAKPKSPKRIRVSAQTRHDIAHSLKTGTVPSRYRSQVPKEYQRYIPFER